MDQHILLKDALKNWGNMQYFSPKEKEYILEAVENYEILKEEKDKYFEIIKWIKKQYDDDFTEEEIMQLEPRDSSIYKVVERIIRK